MAYLSPSATNTKGMNYDALLYCKTNLGGYFFDGFLSVSHSIETEITEHPVETGAAIVDHAYVKPVTLEMEIIMSDAHQSFIPNQFVGKYPRHVEAWNLLKQLQADRLPLSVFTKLGQYDNMLIKKISAEDTSETFSSLKASVTLQEIPIARVKTIKISANPQTTQQNYLTEKRVEKAGRDESRAFGQ